MTEKQIKDFYERIFCLVDNCSWEMYLSIKRMEQSDLDKIK